MLFVVPRVGNSLIGFFSESLVFVRKRANERIVQKTSYLLICSFLVSDSLTVAHSWWAICSQSLIVGEQSDRSSHWSLKRGSERIARFFLNLQKYDFIQMFFSESLIFCEGKSDSLRKNKWFAQVALLSWAICTRSLWANRSRLLVFGE